MKCKDAGFIAEIVASAPVMIKSIFRTEPLFPSGINPSSDDQPLLERKWPSYRFSTVTVNASFTLGAFLLLRMKEISVHWYIK